MDPGFYTLDFLLFFKNENFWSYLLPGWVLDQNNLESRGPLFDSRKKKIGPAGLSKKTLASRQPAGCGASRKNHAQNLGIFHHLRQKLH